ncbi:MAG: helix-turn-helix transcriptional regulator [Candidatus Harrisonbacteria bacterium]|nr:helix-turn-helix transcriptional regulator [Candidatus Harrisonbacteria bacterium]
MKNMSVNQKLAVRIKQIRLKKGLAAREVAKRCNMNLRNYQRLESAKPPDLRASKINRIAKALGISLRYLFTF